MRKITLYVSINTVYSDYETVVEVPDDINDGELRDMAEDFLHDYINYGWFEDTDEDE